MKISKHDALGTPGVARRDLLKSTLLTAMGASLPFGSAIPVQAAESSTVSAGAGADLHGGKIGFTLSHEQFPVPELIRLSAPAERAGFDFVTVSDHFQPWQADENHAGQAWITLGVVGQQTRHIGMGPMVTCPTLRYHPAVVAEAFATLSLLYPGRIYLGLGSGEALNEQAATGQWPAWRERWDRLIEASDIIRQLWTGQTLKHAGRHYSVNARLYDPPAQPIPLLLAANGPKAMKLAGMHGDGLITDPKIWKEHKGEWESGARAVGRDPRTMPVLVEAFVVVGNDAEATPAAKLWNFLPKAFKGYENIPDPAAIEQRAQKEIPLKKVYEDWTVSSDPSMHVKGLEKLFSSGVTAIAVHSAQPDQQKVIDFYGTQVLPHVNRQPEAA